MKQKRKLIPVLMVLLITVAGVLWFLRGQPTVPVDWLARLGLGRPQEGRLVASGFIEAEEVAISSEVGGRIKAIHVDEGDEVSEGQVLIELDDALLRAQLEVAEAAVELARAGLARVKAGVPETEIRRAEALVRQAEVARDVARQGWEDAVAARDNPQSLDGQIVAARGQLAVAQAELEQAIASKDALEAGKEQVGSALDTLTRGIEVTLSVPGVGEVTRTIRGTEEQLDELKYQHGLLTNQWWAAWEAVNMAQARRDGVARNLAQLQAMREEPLSLEAQVVAARGRYEVAEAAVQTARAQLEALRAGATIEQVQVAEAELRQAEAARDRLLTQLEKMQLKAPRAGLVVERVAHAGEMALPGASLLTLANLDNVTLTVYVPTNAIGRLRVGQPATVTVDAFPERAFSGTVIYIASEAEFTPKNVQTQEERVKQVFGVKIRLPNPDHALKPGMPADAVIGE